MPISRLRATRSLGGGTVPGNMPDIIIYFVSAGQEATLGSSPHRSAVPKIDRHPVRTGARVPRTLPAGWHNRLFT